ncbi:hypothetical protein Trydic_g14085 [Trypoxylus dichotomus]
MRAVLLSELSYFKVYDEKPVEYASRLLTSVETNYSTIEREALAVVRAVEKFRTYIEGAEVNIASDHQPFQWLFSLKTPSPRIARWTFRIQAVNMKLVYTPGKSNATADMLSRPFGKIANRDTSNLYLVTVEFPSLSYEEVRGQQLEDPELEKIVRALDGEDIQEATLGRSHKYVWKRIEIVTRQREQPQSNCGFRELHPLDYALPKETRKNLARVKRISSAEARPEKGAGG